MADLDFAQLQIKKANELTDRIMAMLGALFLKKELGQDNDIMAMYSVQREPRDAINQEILAWLTEEKIDG
jgi:hypothetical protein